VRSVNLSCSTAAACAPIAGMSRALAKPGIGAFAKIEIETGLVFGGDIALRESPRILPDFTAEFSGPVRS
jgi:hypothetical protein